MEAKLRLLDDLKSRIDKGYVNFKKSPKDRINQAYIDSRLEILEKQYQQFVQKHDELLENYTEKELSSTSYFQNDVFEDVMDTFITYKVDLKNSLPKSKASISCPHCSEEHLLCYCKKFAQKSVEQRRNIIKSRGLCFNCLRSSHISINCRAKTKCRICKKRHHTLLHQKSDSGTEKRSSASPIKLKPPDETTAEPHLTAHFAQNIQSQDVLATALIKVRPSNEHPQVLRALLDQGSQASFITECAVQKLKLKKMAVKTTISGVGGSQGNLTSKFMVRVNIQSMQDPNFTFETKAYVLSKINAILPERKFTLVDWPELGNITPNKIDILLGSGAYAKLLKNGLIKDPTGKIMAQDTYLGWIISGEVKISLKEIITFLNGFDRRAGSEVYHPGR
ncbi:hypothetical protein SFRURICE_014684 [Spodoptera frugiperda]|nr:hypothetical protein SFRURICE_014684 [Spodoptera frugiperda]